MLERTKIHPQENEFEEDSTFAVKINIIAPDKTLISFSKVIRFKEPLTSNAPPHLRAWSRSPG